MICLLMVRQFGSSRGTCAGTEDAMTIIVIFNEMLSLEAVSSANEIISLAGFCRFTPPITSALLSGYFSSYIFFRLLR